VLCRFLVSLITLCTNVTSTLLIGGKKHDNLWQKGSIGGEPDRKHLLEQVEISNNEVVVLFDPMKLVYEVKSSSQTNVGGEVSGGYIFRVEIDDVVSRTCHRTTHYLLRRKHGSLDLSLC
jgi:hypothetical protein